MNVFVTIGNSDNRLTQEGWSVFVAQVDKVVRDYADTVHGQFFSAPDSKWQNACWSFEAQDARIVERVRYWLSDIAAHFVQDSIALNVSPVTDFIEPRPNRVLTTDLTEKEQSER